MESHSQIKIVIAEPNRFSTAALQKLQQLSEVVLGPFSQQEFVAVCKEATVVVLRLQHTLDTSFFEQAKKLKFIVTPTTGLNHIDEAQAAAHHVKIISLKGEYDFLQSIPSTAEHTWALLLAMLRKIPQANAHVLNGNWNRDLFISRNLNTLKLGILGFGRVGAQIATYAQAFKMPFVSYDTDPEKKNFSHAVQELKEFLQQIDVLSIHIPLNQENKLFLNSSNLAYVKDGAFLINTSRGEIIKEDDVVGFLKSNKISGIATDVLSGELDDESRMASPLLRYAKSADNCIITPHIAGATIDSMQMTEDFVVKKLVEQWR